MALYFVLCCVRNSILCVCVCEYFWCWFVCAMPVTLFAPELKRANDLNDYWKKFLHYAQHFSAYHLSCCCCRRRRSSTIFTLVYLPPSIRRVYLCRLCMLAWTRNVYIFACRKVCSRFCHLLNTLQPDLYANVYLFRSAFFSSGTELDCSVYCYARAAAAANSKSYDSGILQS